MNLQFKRIPIICLISILGISQILTTVNAANFPVSYTRLNAEIRIDEKSKNKKNKGKFIVKLKDYLSEQERQDFFNRNNIVNIPLVNKVSIENISEIKDTTKVELIEEDGVLELQTLSANDPLLGEQWYFEALGQDRIINSTNYSELKTIAVIDSGVCVNHPDLKDRILDGWNFINSNTDVSDYNGHGCAVAGMIAANINNNIGIIGGTISAKILPLKIVDNDNTANYSDLINAIDYAVEKNVDVINISLGGLFDSQILHDSIIKAVNKDIKVVASAGNTSSNEIMYPAKFSEVISVGSIENDYTVSDYSSNSIEIDMWAYGNNIMSTNKEGKYSTSTGTSIATAIASAFILQDGKYSEGNILSYYSDSIKPVFKNKLINYEEPISKLSFKVPENLNVEGFENINPQGYVINWQKVIKLAQGETLAISVWNREHKDIRKVLKDILEMDKCSEYKLGSLCILRYKEGEIEYYAYGKYILQNNSLIRIQYVSKNFIGFNLLKHLSIDIKLNNKRIINDNDIEKINKGIDRIYPQGATTCGGLTDTNNPYGCCSSSIPGQNDANCTWYAAYKRPDLKGTITLWPEGLFTQAQQAGFPTSSQPSQGALIVWQLHVGYVESFTANSVTWSEQNCYSTNNPYNASVTRNSHTPGYSAGNFLGYIHFKNGSNDCNGLNQSKQNWNINGPRICSPTGTFTIMPESRLQSSGGDITIRAL